jgi:hypothetical protein
MSVNFVTIERQAGHYAAVLKKYRIFHGGDDCIKKCIASALDDKKCLTRDQAEDIAKRFASRRHYQYVDENVSVISSMPLACPDDQIVFVPVELTAAGKHRGIGVTHPTEEESIEQAKQIARERRLPALFSPSLKGCRCTIYLFPFPKELLVSR